MADVRFGSHSAARRFIVRNGLTYAKIVKIGSYYFVIF